MGCENHEFPAVWGFDRASHAGANLVGRVEMVGVPRPRVHLAIWPREPGKAYDFMVISPARMLAMAEDVARALANDDGAAETIMIAGQPFAAAQAYAMQRIFTGLAEQLREVGHA